MKFSKEMLEVDEILKEMGHHPILPIDVIDCINDPSLNQNIDVCIEMDVIRDHLKKIQESDAILVLNHEKNGVPGYVGGSSLIEMGFAHFLNKKIFLLNPIPKINYDVEIKIMQPIVLNGDLTKI